MYKIIQVLLVVLFIFGPVIQSINIHHEDGQQENGELVYVHRIFYDTGINCTGKSTYKDWILVNYCLDATLFKCKLNSDYVQEVHFPDWKSAGCVRKAAITQYNIGCDNNVFLQLYHKDKLDFSIPYYL